MKKRIFTVLFSIFYLSVLMTAQDDTKIAAVDDYVSFVNESIHGLLIVHRLMEDYNREINKYVDLPGYKINNISNKDLPANIFEDKQHLFYDNTPFELFEKLKTHRGKGDDKLFKIANDIFSTINKINNIRFVVAGLIDTTDLTKRENLKVIYDKMEEAVDLFDLFYAYQLNLEYELSKSGIHTEKNNKIKLLEAIYDTAKDILLSVRVKRYENFDKKIDKLDNLYFNAKKKFPEESYVNTKILSRIQGIISEARQLYNHPMVSDAYKLYGKDYYYYNVKLIDKYNKYGNGFVGFMNKYLGRYDIGYKFEFPHYFKVIYPVKLEKKIERIVSKIKNIRSLPEILENRKVLVASDTIHSDGKNSIIIKIYDYKIQDGDIVSINFNGEWIYKNISLETKPKEIELKLNESGKNYLVFHSENTGRIPPNTIGINYTYKGKKRKIILSPDAKKSILIEIK